MEPIDGDTPPPPPFWPPTTVNHHRRRLSPPSPPFLNPALLIILIPITILLLVFFILHPFLNVSSQILKPTTTVNGSKKSWESVTILLVLFAILGGVFARKDDNDNRASTTSISTTTTTTNQCIGNLNLNPSQQWFDQYQFQKVVVTATTPSRVGLRSSSSYPDLRQDSVSVDDRFSFFDDYELDIYRNSTVDGDFSGRTRQRLVDEESEIEVIPVDEFESHSPPPPPPPPPERLTIKRTTHRSVRKEKSEVKRPKTPPPHRSSTSDDASPSPPFPPPSESERPNVRRSTRASYRSIPRTEQSEVKRPRSPPSASSSPQPSPPPPLPENVAARSEEMKVRIERKKNNATKELKMVLASMYNQRRKKKTQKTKIIIDDSLHSAPSSIDLGYRQPQPQPPPPPPPLPPPPSVFNSLFKKSSKSKIVHPTPPPPIFRSSKLQTKIPTPENSGRPPLPSKTNNFYGNLNDGGKSPSIPLPPPPPPPYQATEMKFSVRGGYDRVQSTHSTFCSSPELEDVDLSKDGMDGGDLIGSSVCCPSPDVNLKADDFIAKLRSEWKLQKNNSLKMKQAFGHGPGPC